MKRQSSPRNRTINLTQEEINSLKKKLLKAEKDIKKDTLTNKIINGDVFAVLPHLPDSFVDLMVVDPPYNLTKEFQANKFKKTSVESYAEWLDSWLSETVRLLKPNASIYICSDWLSSTSIHMVASKYFKIQNRITWQREKGRGAKANWKNCSEDIWFCTMSDDYTFNLDKVKVKRRVIAPYKDKKGAPKGWDKKDGGNFRMTHPSNIWDDVTVPFWSMPENTEHPTQKPEKLLARMILASSNEGDVVFDPFLGSGTTAVVAKKLKRKYSGIEINEKYCCLAEKRLLLAESNSEIQGYRDGVFWERNSLNALVTKPISVL